MQSLPFRGTLLNTLTVAVGATIGMLFGHALPERLQVVSLTAIGLVTLAFGVKNFLETKNVLVPTVALFLGGLVGAILGLDSAVAAIAEWARERLGGGGTFNEGLITASVLFCVGPMTLLGCIQDGLERKIELLAIKSTLDFVAALFLSAALGSGVMASAAVVLVVQGTLTALSSPLKPLAERPGLLAEATATGGLLLVAIGLNLLKIAVIPTEVFLPALLMAPALVPLFGRLNQAK